MPRMELSASQPPGAGTYVFESVRMSKRHQRWVIGLAGLAIFMALVVPAVFGTAPEVEGRVGGDPWRNWVAEFQTLITGVLAVSAAAWTVLTMERTDASSEARHRELVALSLRRDALQVDQLLDPDREEFIRCEKDLQAFLSASSEISAKRGVLDKWYRSIQRVADTREELLSVLSKEAWVEARPLFNAALHTRILNLRQRLDELGPHLTLAKNGFVTLATNIREIDQGREDAEVGLDILEEMTLAYKVVRQDQYVESLQLIDENLREELPAIISDLRSLSVELDRLRSRYAEVLAIEKRATEGSV